MKHYLLCFLMSVAFASACSQGLSLNTTSTPSICYNDGTIAAKASGGVAPYSYSIIAGPTHPNLNYPIILPLGSDTFIDLPSGTFTVVVADAASHIDTFSASVGGTYQFPNLALDTTSMLGIIALVSGGLHPLQYAISTLGSDTGFSAYQRSDTFLDLCPGTYWVRVIDSCGNIYTVSAYFSYKISFTDSCVNFSKGTLNIRGSGGHTPYTYTCTSGAIQITNTTGNFTGLSHYSVDNITVTDSCGVSYSSSISPPVITFVETCPFDSNLYYSSGFNTTDNYTIICASCIPVQTYSGNYISSFYNDTIFKYLNNPSNDIVILSSGCGVDTIQTQVQVSAPTTYFNIQYLSCNSVSIELLNAYYQIIHVDSFVLSTVQGSRITSSIDSIAYFYNLSTPTALNASYGLLTVTAYIQSNCPIHPSYSFAPPYLTAIPILMKDSICQTTIELSANPIANEVYSLVYPNGDTIIGNPVYSPKEYHFYNLTPNQSYTLISDSGCIGTFVPASLTPYLTFNSDISSTVPCVGNPEIIYNGGLLDNAFNFYLYYNDSLINSTLLYINSNWQSITTVQDTGWYTYRTYISRADPPVVDFDGSAATHYDTICPMDSGRIYVTDSHIPFPYPGYAYVCHSRNVADPIPYHIYGGSLPYTVEIQGYDTFSLSTNSGVFIAPHPGDYTMLVYDNCGISRSYTFSVIDTCPPCIIHDTIRASVCQGFPYFLDSISLTQTGTYTDTVYTNGGCDSIIALFLTVNPIVYQTIDTTICSNSSYIIGGHSYTSTGVYVDTINILQGCSIVTSNLIVYSAPNIILNKSICQGDSVLFGFRAYYQSGTYIDTFSLAYGCDSIVTLNLTVNPLPSPIMISESGTTCPIGRDTLIISGDYTYPFSWLKNDSVIEVVRQTVTTVAGGNGYGSYYTQLTYPQGIYVDTSGNLYISDENNNRIQKWAAGATGGSTVAGDASGWGGNDIYSLQYPTDVFLDKSGNIYIADADNNRIMKWAPGASSGTCVAGNISGQGGSAANLLNTPTGIFVDDTGNIYIADLENNRVQKWAPGASSGTTVAGSSTGQLGTSDNLLQYPSSIYLDQQGALYIADSYNNRIQKWTAGASSGVTVAGNANGLSGNNDSLLSLPTSIFVDQAGNLYIGDTYNNRIQKWASGANYGITVASSSYVNAFNQGLWVDKNGAIYVSDQGNYRVRKFTQNFTYIPTSFGTYTATVTNAYGCTAISNAIILQNQISRTLNDTICQGESIVIGSNNYSQSGTFIDTFGTSYGCDSIVTLNLTVYPTATTDLYDTICQGASILIGTHSYTQTGVYLDTFTTIHGCDSVAALHLTVFPSPHILLYDTICHGSSITIGSNSYSQGGIYIDTLHTFYGCDSIVTLALTVLALDTPSIYILGSISPPTPVIVTDTFTAVYSNCMNPYFNWYRNGVSLNIHTATALVRGPISQLDTITCVISCDTMDGSCLIYGTTSCHIQSVNGISTISSISGVNIYPNPTQGNFDMDITTTDISNKTAQISVTDMMGQNILSIPVILHSGNNKELISLSQSTVSGVYIVQLSVDGQSLYYRIVLDKQN